VTTWVSSFRALLSRHHRALVVGQVIVLAVMFAVVGWAIRGNLHDVGDRLRDASLADFAVACALIVAYYLLFVVGWTWILGAWHVRIGYFAALQAEMVSMLAKYVPGGVWTPAARVVAARRAGVNDAGLVTASILVEAGLSAVSGVVVFVISLAWVRRLDEPIWPVIAFGAVLAVVLHPRIFHPVASRVLRRFGTQLPPLPTGTLIALLIYYSFTWLVGGAALFFLVRAVGGDPDPTSIPFLGGTSAVGAIAAVLAIFTPSGLGAREGAMAVLIAAVTSVKGAPAASVVLNRVGITIVEIALLVVGAIFFRLRDDASALHAEVGPESS
jgi:hypothetical protein